MFYLKVLCDGAGALSCYPSQYFNNKSNNNYKGGNCTALQLKATTSRKCITMLIGLMHSLLNFDQRKV